MATATTDDTTAATTWNEKSAAAGIRRNTARGRRRHAPPRRDDRSLFERRTVKELKEMCRERGLPVSGKKAELARRICEHRPKSDAERAGVPVVRWLGGVRLVAVRNGDDVYSLFGVEEPVNDAETMAAGSAADARVLSQGISTTPRPGRRAAPVPVTDRKSSGPMTLSQLSQSSLKSIDGGIYGSQPTLMTAGTAIVPPSAPAKVELTEEQMERKRRSWEEAQKRKRAKLGAPTPAGGAGVNGGGGCSGMNAAMGSQRKTPYEGVGNVNQYGGARSTGAGSSGPAKKTRSGPVFNPYARGREVKRDESRPDDSILNPYKRPECEALTLKDLPALPPDAPPVREETSRRLSEQQLEVVMAARPPHGGDAATALGSDADAEGEGGATRKELFPEHHMVRVNAAAGTGKTTTLLHLASRLVDLGHADVRYVTYSKASARDAQERVRGMLDEQRRARVTASTLHSCAYTLLEAAAAGDERNDGDERSKKPLEETEFKRWMDEKWGKRLDDYLAGAVLYQKNLLDGQNELHKLDGKVKLLREKALQLLFRTFTNFTRKGMSLERLKDPQNKSRHHYSITKRKPDSEFGPEGSARKLGFPDSYGHPGSYEFFANLCIEIWEHAEENAELVRTYDIDVKRAQLNGLRIPCTALLVDECQDMDGAQVAWIADQQRKYGTHVFLVGDSAQCIYGFRGARSSNVMKLNCVDLELTKSWRFGPSIARVANVPLFVKEMSPQTSGNHGDGRVWMPYRVEGARRGDGEEDAINGRVTTKSMLADWRKRGPIALIGRTNAGLMIKAMDLLGLAGLKNSPDKEEGDGGKGLPSDAGEDSAAAGEGVAAGGRMPKFHVVSGEGETSGCGRWRQVIMQVRHLFELYTNRDETGYLPMNLPTNIFKEFEGEAVSWDTFYDLKMVREITNYDIALHLVSLYRQNTLEALDIFEANVTNNVDISEANIIMTTCHGAKGLEWDHVEVCEDLLDLSATPFGVSKATSLRHPSFLAAMPSEEGKPEIKSEMKSLIVSKGERRNSWEFGLTNWQCDPINLLYVAFTRARKTLAVPESLKQMLEKFDKYHHLIGTFTKSASGVDGEKITSKQDEARVIINTKEGDKKTVAMKLNKGELWNLYHDLCHPLRRELGVEDGCLILPSLFPGEQGEDYMQNLSKLEEGPGESEVKSEAKPSVKAEPDIGGTVAESFDC